MSRSKTDLLFTLNSCIWAWLNMANTLEVYLWVRARCFFLDFVLDIFGAWSRGKSPSTILKSTFLVHVFGKTFHRKVWWYLIITLVNMICSMRDTAWCIVNISIVITIEIPWIESFCDKFWEKITLPLFNSMNLQE